MRTLRWVLLAAPLVLFAQAHKSPLAGTWYPGDAPSLQKLLDQSFTVAEKRTGGPPPRKGLRGLVVPHAGIVYSGTVAAAAYRLLDHPKNVVVLGFSHRRPLEGIVAPDVNEYVTPLGAVKVNRAALKQLGIPSMPEDRLCDHSLEIQLPYLQRVAPDTSLIPLYVGELSAAQRETAARALAKRMLAGDVVIASSDFTHYGGDYGYTPFPNDKEAPGRLFRMAMAAFDEIGSLDISAFDRYLADTGDTICGRAPIRLLMASLARMSEEIYQTPIDYLASGELTRDYSTSVSYGALAFYPASSFQVSEISRKKLLASARQTLDGYLASGKKVAIPAPQTEGGDLDQKSGLFVTIRKGGQLRGCVGALLLRAPLREAVAERTLAAATEDSRFPPVTKEDGPLSLEISLLTPARKLGDWRQFRVGHGAILMLDGKSGLLLPQVAAEQGWSTEQFLENLGLKAGLTPKAYRDPRATLYAFSAQVFAEASPAEDSRQ